MFSSILKSVPGVFSHKVAASDFEPCFPHGYWLQSHLSCITFSTMIAVCNVLDGVGWSMIRGMTRELEVN